MSVPFTFPALGGAGSRFQTRENLEAEVRRVLAQEKSERQMAVSAEASARAVAVAAEGLVRSAGDTALQNQIDALSSGVRVVGEWDASSAAFPTTRPGGGAIQPGDAWVVSADGTVDGVGFVALDRLVSLGDGGATYAGNWLRAGYSDVLDGIGAATFIPAGGTTPRTISGKAGERLSVQDFGADPTGATDSTAAFNAAAAASGVVYIPKGVFKISDMLTLAGKMMVGDGRRRSIIRVDAADFNMSAAAVLKFTGIDAGIGLVGVGIEFVQPSAPANRAALNAYPVAVDASGASRGHFDDVRVSGGTDGFDFTGNTGGLYIGRVECGCVGTNFIFNGPLDFINLSSVHVWCFGYTTAEQVALFGDGNTIALRITGAGCDGFKATSFQAWRSRVVIDPDSTTILPIKFTSLSLDGEFARLVVSNGRVQIGSLYNTKSITATFPSIDVSGGRVTIADLQQAGGEIGGQIRVTGGNLQINGGEWFHNRSNAVAGIVSGGLLSVRNTRLRWPPGVVRTEPFIEQSGTGVVQIGGCTPEHYTNTSDVVEIGTDVTGADVDLRSFWPHTAILPATLTNGLYRLQKTFTASLTPATVGDWSAVYGVRTGWVALDGDWFGFWLRLVATPTFTTASGALTVTGLPVPFAAISELPVSAHAGVAFSSGRTDLSLRLSASGAELFESGAAQAVTVSRLTSGAQVSLFITGRGRL